MTGAAVGGIITSDEFFTDGSAVPWHVQYSVLFSDEELRVSCSTGGGSRRFAYVEHGRVQYYATITRLDTRR